MKDREDEGRETAALNRRKVLECMTWAGAGVLWTVAGGVPRSLGIVGEAMAADAGSVTFVQISDSHIGFDKPANTDVTATLRAAIAKIKAAPEPPSFVLHTGDLTHLSRPSEFDTLQQVLSELSMPVFYVPGEHDVLEDDGSSYLQRFGTGTQGAGWYSFDQGGVHFIGLVNVVNLKAGGLGTLGVDQLEWLEGRIARTLEPARRSSSSPTFPCGRSTPSGAGAPTTARQALALVKRFGSVSVLNGHIHQVMQKVEGHVTFHTAMSTAFPQPAPGSAPSPGPMKVPADKLRKVLGITEVNFKQGQQRLAIVDVPLQS